MVFPNACMISNLDCSASPAIDGVADDGLFHGGDSLFVSHRRVCHVTKKAELEHAPYVAPDGIKRLISIYNYM
jgi:hypothetical protein